MDRPTVRQRNGTRLVSQSSRLSLFGGKFILRIESDILDVFLADLLRMSHQTRDQSPVSKSSAECRDGELN